MKVWVFGLTLLLASSGTFGSERELTSSEKELVENAVKEVLADPASTTIKWMPYREKSGVAYCGLVNTKDPSGEFTGYVPFVVALFSEGTERMLISDPVTTAIAVKVDTADPEAAVSYAIRSLCADKGYPDLQTAVP